MPDDTDPPIPGWAIGLMLALGLWSLVAAAVTFWG